MTTSVMPRIHSNGEVSADIISGRFASPRVKETIAALARRESWLELWEIADSCPGRSAYCSMQTGGYGST